MKDHKKATYAIVTILCVVLFAIWYIKDREAGQFATTVPSASETSPVMAVSAAEGTPAPSADPPPEAPAPSRIKVYVTGAVAEPGVYELEEGKRIEDAVALAGGATGEADLTGVNLSKRVRDEQQITVPKTGEAPDPSVTAPEGEEEPEGGPVNINTADKEKLKTLPGVGDVIADAIIEYRETAGPFQTVEEIKNVRRVGDKTFEGFKDGITVSD